MGMLLRSLLNTALLSITSSVEGGSEAMGKNGFALELIIPPHLGKGKKSRHERKISSVARRHVVTRQIYRPKHGRRGI
jgi:hypothetical protein